MNARRLLTSLMVVLSAVAFAGPASAMLVKNGATVIFADDYEGVPVGSTADNGALPGFWAGLITSVESAATFPIPGPFEGNKFNRLYGTGTTADFDVTQTSGTIKMDTMWYVPSGLGDFGSYFTIQSGAGGNIMGVSYQSYTPSGGPTQWWLMDIAHNVWLAPVMVFDKWVHVSLEYTLGDNKGKVGFEGVSYPFNFTDLTRVSGTSSRIKIGRDAPSGVFLDAIPEPASLGLLLLGGLALLRRR